MMELYDELAETRKQLNDQEEKINEEVDLLDEYLSNIDVKEEIDPSELLEKSQKIYDDLTLISDVNDVIYVGGKHSELRISESYAFALCSSRKDPKNSGNNRCNS